MNSGVRQSAVALAIALITLLIAAVIWAALAEIDQVVHAQGRTIPDGRLKAVQPAFDGVIETIHVREGDRIEAGAPVVTLARDVLRARIDSARRQRAERAEEAAVATAVIAAIEGTQVAVDAVTAAAAPVASRAAVTAWRARLQGKQQEVRVKGLELEALGAQRGTRERAVALIARELEAMQALHRTGDLSIAEVIAKQREHNDAQARLIELEGRVDQLEGEVAAARTQTEVLRTGFLDEQYRRRAAARVAVAELDGRLAELHGRLDRAVVVAPSAGVVNSMAVTTVGAVVRPGERIAEIVPVSDRLLVKARVRPDRTGFIETGQAARVKVGAYDFTTYGALDGRVAWIGADTIEDEQGNRYYPVHVVTDDRLAGRDGRPLPITSGMTVTVDIITAKGTVLEYLLKPILRGFSNALSER